MKKQIIFIAQQLEAGGLEKAIITLANALNEREDYEVSLYIVLHSKSIVPIENGIHVKFITERVLKEKLSIVVD